MQLRRILFWVISFSVVLNTLTGVSVIGSAKAAESAVNQGGVQVFTEDFSTFALAGMTDHTRWDVWNRKLELDQLDAPAQTSPDIAPVGNGEAIVVWEDERNGNTDIFAQHIDAQGNRLWQNDLRVNTDGSSTWQNSPRIAADGNGQFIIVWRDGRNNRADIYAQRFNLNGSLLWPSDRQVNVDTGTKGKEGPCIAINNSGQVLIAWQDDRSNHLDIYVQRFDYNGNRIWQNDVRINADTGTEFQQFPSIIADSSGQFIIVWTDRRNNGNFDIYAQRIDANANRAWGSDIRVNADYQPGWQVFPVIAGIGGGQYMVAWEDDRNEASYTDIYAQIIDLTGSHLLSQDFRVNAYDGNTWEGGPVIASDQNGQAQITWLGGRGVYTQRVDQNGTRLFPQDVRVSSLEESAEQKSPAMVATGGNFVTIVWTGDSRFNTDIFAQTLNSVGSRTWLADKRVSAGNGTAHQMTPAVAVDSAGNAVIVWRDLRNGTCAIYAQALDSAGKRLWKADQRIANVQHCQATDDTTITVNSDGRFLIVWSDGELLAQLIDINGNRLWQSDLTISSGSYVRDTPAAAALTNGQFIVTWVSWGTGAGETNIYAQRIDTLGNMYWSEDRPVNDAPDSSRQFAPAVAADSNGSAIIVWQDQRNHLNGTPLYDVYAQRLDLNGNRTWSTDLRVSDPISTEHNDPQITSIAGGRFIVTWQDPRHAAYGWDIFAQRIDSSGNRAWASDLRVNTDPGNAYQGTPMIISNANGQAMLAWTDNRNGTVQIYAQRLDAVGNRLWSSDVQGSKDSSFTGTYFMSAARDQNGNALVAWQDSRFGNGDIFIQKVLLSGSRGWSADLQIINPDNFVFTEGTAQSLTAAAVSGNIRSATLTSDFQTNGGSIQFSLSNDGGISWEEVIPGVNHVFSSAGTDLRWKVKMTADPAWSRSPAVLTVRIEYSTGEIGGDAYEADDSCLQAASIAANGAEQVHTFHQAGDADWVWFDVTEGQTYIIQTSQAEANADTVIDIYQGCAPDPLASNDNVFGSDARITWRANFNGRVYALVSNSDPNRFGEATGYRLSVRLASQMQPPVVVIVAGRNDRDTLRQNIDSAADMAYRTFLKSGIPRQNIRYLNVSTNRDVDGNGTGTDDIYGPPSIAAVRSAIQDWGRLQGVRLGVPFYLYLVDHGNPDQVLVNGSGEKITAQDLNLWLTNLETTTGTDQVNVIIEACYSGSFIDVDGKGPSKISGRNRVVITSTSSRQNAYPSASGAFFSDVFLSELGQNTDLKSAFDKARQAVAATGLSQQPWLDDNGDGIADDHDGMLARARGLGAAFAGNPPVIDLLTVQNGQIEAVVRDDYLVESVWVEIYQPGFVEPGPADDGTIPTLNLLTIQLSSVDGKHFTAPMPAQQMGAYRVILYATDPEGNHALPVSLTIEQGSKQFLPLILR